MSEEIPGRTPIALTERIIKQISGITPQCFPREILEEVCLKDPRAEICKTSGKNK